jgi:hypothetical protein
MGTELRSETTPTIPHMATDSINTRGPPSVPDIWRKSSRPAPYWQMIYIA